MLQQLESEVDGLGSDRLPFLPYSPPPLEMRGRVNASGVRCRTVCGSEIRAVLADVGFKFQRAEMQRIRWMSDVFMKHRMTCEVLRKYNGYLVNKCSQLEDKQTHDYRILK